MSDPRDNIRSILNRLNLPGNLRKFNVRWSRIDKNWKPIFYANYWGFKEYKHYIDFLAARWNLAADVYLRNSSKMVLVRYEDFCSDKVGVIEEIASKLGIEKKNDISDKVDVQYQPRGDRNISWLDFFGIENLLRIEKICKDNMKKFGYKRLIE